MKTTILIAAVLFLNGCSIMAASLTPAVERMMNGKPTQEQTNGAN